MLETGPIISIPRVSFTSKELKPQAEGEKSVFDRQIRIPGWRQEKVRAARISCIGAGGLGGHALQNLARLGVKVLRVCDADLIELSNLNRQFFYHDQLYKNKALCLAENLVKECTGETTIEGFSMDFQDVIREFPDVFEDSDVILCLVDNEESRYDASRYAFEREIPVVFAAVSDSAVNGYVFLQDNKSGCYACLWHSERDKDDSEKRHCVAPSAIYMHSIIIGLVVYEALSVLMDWREPWRYYEFFLDGSTRAFTPGKIRDCPICGTPSTAVKPAIVPTVEPPVKPAIVPTVEPPVKPTAEKEVPGEKEQ